MSLFSIKLYIIEVEQAKDFLNAVGFSDLSKLFQQGEEISENVLNQSMRLRNLTEKQTETIRNRIRTLNRTLRSRQPKRKPRQDIRDIAWNVEVFLYVLRTEIICQPSYYYLTSCFPYFSFV